MRSAALRLALLLIVGGQAGRAAQPFSHQLHLQLKLECAHCHSAALTSTSARDNLLPGRQVCLECHRDATIPPPPVSRVSKFSHQLHLKLGNVAPALRAAIGSKTYLATPPPGLRAALETKNTCQACHRFLDKSTRVSSANMPAMADCLVCHNKIEVPYSCELCHDNVASLKPANHTPDFLDTHTSGKLKLDKTTCAVCHGRQFTCLGCH